VGRYRALTLQKSLRNILQKRFLRWTENKKVMEFGTVNVLPPLKPNGFIDVLPRLTLSNSTFCPRSVFVCFVWIWERTTTVTLYSIKWLVFITETECVYCAVRTGSLNIILRCAHTVYLCVLCGSENKQLLLPYTELNGWFL
jgi:hypothetical protein